MASTVGTGTEARLGTKPSREINTPVHALRAWLSAHVSLGRPATAVGSIVRELPGRNLDRAHLALHVLLRDEVVLELSPLAVVLPLDMFNVAFNDAGTGVLALVGYPGVSDLVLALVLLPAEVLRCGLLNGMEVPLWTPVATQRAFLNA